jgi:hypothetical protein
LLARLRTQLAATAAASGGWPYYEGKRGRIEPTCWALLALDPGSAPNRQAARTHVAFLATLQRSDGFLVDVADGPPNLAVNGLAACVLPHVCAAGGPDVSRLLSAITALKGVKTAQDGSSQDNSLQAWPWVADTFSWVEPTAWCTLALKQARRREASAALDARVHEAELMLANRACRDGGWNYGNATVFNQDLRPYVPTTALALMALQDRPADAVVQRSMAALTARRLTERSPFALSLASIALRLHGAPSDAVDAALEESTGRAERTGNLQAIAMAAYVLSSAQHNLDALRV